MSIDFPNSPSNGDTYSYSGETYRYNGVAWVRVRDRVTTFNGATGAIIGVTSVQGKTGDVTLTDLEITHGVETFNGLSGSVEGVSSFNGLTGSVDTSSLTLQIAGVTLGAGGITFSDGTQLTSEGQIAFKNEQNTFTDNQFITAGKGIGANGLDLGIRFDANQVVVIGDPENSTNSVKLTVDDNDAVVKVENANFDIPTSIRHLGDTNTKIQFGTDTVDFDAGGREGMKLTATETQFNDGIRITSAGITFADDTLQKGAAKGVATFTIQSSSAISTSSKTNAMYRIPYNATLLGLQGKITANGNMRGSIDIAGSDFGDPTTGHATAITFQHTSGGNTFVQTSIDQASVDAGDYLYVDVSNNASGATGAQFFVTYETR